MECNDCGGNLLPPSVVAFKTAVVLDVEQKCLCFRAALARSPRTLFASFLPSGRGGGKSDSLCWMPHEFARTDDDDATLVL